MARRGGFVGAWPGLRRADRAVAACVGEKVEKRFPSQQEERQLGADFARQVASSEGLCERGRRVRVWVSEIAWPKNCTDRVGNAARC